ncbi:MAG: type IV secretion system DNA-binding domain-containing protein [Bacteroidota bacterium]
MHTPLQLLLSLLLTYQLFYWVYLLLVSDLLIIHGFPYGLFKLSLFTRHSSYFRGLFLLAAAVQYPHLILRLQSLWKSSLCLGLATTFVLLDQCFGCYTAPWAMPLLLLCLWSLLKPHIPKKKLQNPQTSPHPHRGLALPTHQGYLPIRNPQRGIYILGNQGSGKTRFVLEPLLYHMLEQGYAGLIYDYDFEGTPAAPEKSYCLSKMAHNCLLRHGAQGRSLQMINFTDLSRTRRINPFAAAYIQDRAYLEEYVSVLLKNLLPESNQGKNFWINSTQALLKSVLIFLDNKHSQCCTLPHALALAMQPIANVLAALRTDEEAKAYASSLFDAMGPDRKVSGQLAGIIATFKVSLQLLLHPNIFWVLSGDELSLKLNDKQQPTVLCIGNSPPAKAAYSPLIALMITLCFKSMYGHGKVKSFVALDELPTLFLPDLSELPATARKYGISTVTCLQSNAQLSHTYGEIGAKKVQQTLVSKFIGNTEDASAVYGSELLGKRDQEVRSTSNSTSMHREGSSETQGESVQWQERSVLSAQDFMRFSPGEFAGKVAEGHPPFFHTQLKAVAEYDAAFRNEALEELPVYQEVRQEEVDKNYRRIWFEARQLLKQSRA